MLIENLLVASDLAKVVDDTKAFHPENFLDEEDSGVADNEANVVETSNNRNVSVEESAVTKSPKSEPKTIKLATATTISSIGSAPIREVAATSSPPSQKLSKSIPDVVPNPVVSNAFLSEKWFRPKVPEEIPGLTAVEGLVDAKRRDPLSGSWSQSQDREHIKLSLRYSTKKRSLNFVVNNANPKLVLITSGLI